MPFVAAAEALNARSTDLAAVARKRGRAPWRLPLVGADQMRMVLIAYPPGFVSVPHRHPHALESFLVLEGTGNFIIGNRPYGGTPGTLLWSPPGVQHTIAVTGTSDLVFLASIGPNENRPDETIETPIEESVDPAGH